jgi:hypothetical protein
MARRPKRGESENEYNLRQLFAALVRGDFPRDPGVWAGGVAVSPSIDFKSVRQDIGDSLSKYLAGTAKGQ